MTKFVIYYSIISTVLLYVLLNISFNQNIIAQQESKIPQTKELPEISVEVIGTPNDDNIKGGEGDDEIEGKKGDDTLDGGRGDDELNGDEGNDLLKGKRGDDELDGDEGNDNLKGYQGNDLLSGGEGNDTLDGGSGIDELEGGPGADLFICDSEDIIVDFNPQENDTLSESCRNERLLINTLNSSMY